MKILALSEANILSFHSIALIAASEGQGICANKIAKLTKCSRNHLFKVLETMIKAKLIYSTRGPLGGYFLNKPATKIKLIEVFEALNGKIDEDNICVGRNRHEATFGFFQNMCHDLTTRFIKYLKETNVSDLAIKAKIILK